MTMFFILIHSGIFYSNECMRNFKVIGTELDAGLVADFLSYAYTLTVEMGGMCENMIEDGHLIKRSLMFVCHVC